MRVWSWMLAGLCVVPMAASAGEFAWQRLEIADHPYAIEVPGTARASHEAMNWGMFGTTESDSIKVPVKGGEMSATVTSAPVVAIRLAGESLIHTTTRGTVLKQRKGTMTSWTPVSRGGLSGRRLTYEVTVDGVAMQGTMEVFVQSPHILTLDALVPAGTPAADVERFFRSLVVAR